MEQKSSRDVMKDNFNKVLTLRISSLNLISRPTTLSLRKTIIFVVFFDLVIIHFKIKQRTERKALITTI